MDALADKEFNERKAHTDRMRSKLEECKQICDDLLDAPEVRVKELGAAMMELTEDLISYVVKRAENDTTEKLLTLEIDGIKLQNQNLRTLVSMAVGIIRVAPDLSSNEEVVNFLAKSEAYLKGPDAEGGADNA